MVHHIIGCNKCDENSTAVSLLCKHSICLPKSNVILMGKHVCIRRGDTCLPMMILDTSYKYVSSDHADWGDLTV